MTLCLPITESGLVGVWVVLIVLRYRDALKCVLADLRVPRNCFENLCELNGERSLLTMEEERYLYLIAMFGLCASGSKGWNCLLLRLRAGDFRWPSEAKCVCSGPSRSRAAGIAPF
jgi:hypothetical protein